MRNLRLPLNQKANPTLSKFHKISLLKTNLNSWFRKTIKSIFISFYCKTSTNNSLINNQVKSQNLPMKKKRKQKNQNQRKTRRKRAKLLFKRKLKKSKFKKYHFVIKKYHWSNKKQSRIRQPHKKMMRLKWVMEEVKELKNRSIDKK